MVRCFPKLSAENSWVGFSFGMRPRKHRTWKISSHTQPFYWRAKKRHHKAQKGSTLSLVWVCVRHINWVLLSLAWCELWMSVYVYKCVCVFPAVWQKGWQVRRQGFDRRLMRKLSQDTGFAQVTHTHNHTLLHTQWAVGEKEVPFVWQRKYLNPITMCLQYTCVNYTEIALRLAVKTRNKMKQHIFKHPSRWCAACWEQPLLCKSLPATSDNPSSMENAKLHSRRVVFQIWPGIIEETTALSWSGGES